MNTLFKKHWLFILILVIAAVLRFVNVTQDDVVTDEALYGFRSIGYVDYLASDVQTTPVDWFGIDALPGWTKLSFHDHPPVVFLIQYVFFLIFGVSVFVLRLPFVLAGIAAVWLVYLIGRRTQYPIAGVIAAAFLAVDPFHVWISRIGYLESIVIFFVLLSFYFFLRFISTPLNSPLAKGGQWGIWWGIATALALLSKYTALFLVPTYVLYVLLFKRELLKERKLYYGIIAFVVLLIPLIIYNIQLFTYAGHFDLQLASLFHQQTPEWVGISHGVSFAPQVLFHTIVSSVGWGYVVLVLLSIIGLLYAYFKKHYNASFILMMLFLLFLQFSMIGTASRFLPIFEPFFALVLAIGILFICSRLGVVKNTRPHYSFVGLVVLIVLFQALVSINSHVLSRPFARTSLLRVSGHEGDYGYALLDSFIETTVGKKHLADTLDDNSDRSALFIYDSNINYFPRVWYIDRYITYAGVPFTSTDEIAGTSTNGTLGYLINDLGFSEFYFIKSEPGTLRVPEDILSPTAGELEQALVAQGLSPVTVIYNQKGEPAFTIYHF